MADLTPTPSPATTAPLVPMPPGPPALRLDRQKQLDITWPDGTHSTYPLSYLRSHCPCASCKKFREEQAETRSRLTLLPGNYSGPLTALRADLVGNYALRIEWSDDHASGIYSFDYLWMIRQK